MDTSTSWLISILQINSRCNYFTFWVFLLWCLKMAKTFWSKRNARAQGHLDNLLSYLSGETLLMPQLQLQSPVLFPPLLQLPLHTEDSDTRSWKHLHAVHILLEEVHQLAQRVGRPGGGPSLPVRGVLTLWGSVCSSAACPPPSVWPRGPWLGLLLLLRPLAPKHHCSCSSSCSFPEM